MAGAGTRVEYTSEEHRTGCRACGSCVQAKSTPRIEGLARIIGAWGNAVGEDLAPMKDFPHEHQRTGHGGGGGGQR